MNFSQSVLGLTAVGLAKCVVFTESVALAVMFVLTLIFDAELQRHQNEPT